MLVMFLGNFINHLSSSNLSYCILHGWKGLAEDLSSDLDIVINPSDLNMLEEKLLSYEEAQLVQLLQHEASCFYFVLVSTEADVTRFIQLDVATDYRRDGRIFFTSKELLRKRYPWKGFWVASPDVEFRYLLVKRIAKKVLTEKQKRLLHGLQKELGDESNDIVCHLFGRKWGNRVTEWISSCQWIALEANLKSLKHALKWQIIRRDALNPLRYWFLEVRRIWGRLLYPTGLFIAVLGPDGAGKSTLLQHQGNELLGAFRRTAIFHLKPGVLGRRGVDSPVTDPHGKRPRSLAISVLKMLYYLTDYMIGYLVKVRPRLIMSTLVLFDRYYNDIIVDPRRYRYEGPQWLIRLGYLFIPKPDLFLILDLPEEELLIRKQEVSIGELRRQRAGYRELAAKLPNAVLLNGCTSKEEPGRSARETVLYYLHDRYLKRRHFWFSDDRTDVLNWLTAIVSTNSEKMYFAFSRLRKRSDVEEEYVGPFGLLSTKDGRGYLFPIVSRKVGIKALNLYNAQNFKARFGKRLIAIGLNMRLTKPLLRKVQVFIRKDVAKEEIEKISLLERLKKVLKKKDLAFSISFGTPGLHRKPAIQILNRNGEILCYAKVGWNQVTNNLVKHEADILEGFEASLCSSFSVPRVIFSGWWNARFLCIQTAPEGEVKPPPKEMNSQYLMAIKELASFHKRSVSLLESAFWPRVLNRIENISNSYYRRISQDGARKAEGCLGNTKLPFHLRHGDFAPWNVKLADGRLFLFDWEYCGREAPAGWDLFHFIVQTQWLLENKMPGEIYHEVRSAINSRWIGSYWEELSISDRAIHYLFLIYILDRLAFYALEEKTNFDKLQRLAMLVNLCLYSEDL